MVAVALHEFCGTVDEREVELGDRRPGRDQRELELLERLATAVVVGFAGVDERGQRAGVGERHRLRVRRPGTTVDAAPGLSCGAALRSHCADHVLELVASLQGSLLGRLRRDAGTQRRSRPVARLLV